jgi:hypothetical protein
MTKENSIDIEILSELEEFIVSLQKEEYTQLENNLLKEGCREPLVIWEKANKNILIDGHNRYKICIKHSISFKIRKLEFDNIGDVKIWIINNQLGRRNLNTDQLSYYRGLKYESIKKGRGGYSYVESKGQNGPSTAEIVAKEFKVSVNTIKRDSKFTRGLEYIASKNPLLKKRILQGEIKVNKSSINLLAEPDNQKKIRKIINERDLEFKIEKLRDSILKHTENQLISDENRHISKAQKILAKKEPLFLQREDRINRIKGMILSNLNRAIKTSNKEALDEIRKLLITLEDILN